MGLSSFLFFSLLLSVAYALRETPQSSTCSAKFLEDKHRHHLNSSALHLPLHHVHSPCSPISLPLPSPSTLLDHDDHRAAHLVSRLTTTTQSRHHHRSSSLLRPSKSASSIPLNPGTSVGVGNYVSRIGLGNPSRDYIVVVDTGSSLSWVQCQPCRLSCYPQQGPVFDPSTSSSYRPVPCSTPECSGLAAATLNPSGCSQSKVCIYEASYGDGSFSVGYLAKDTLSFSGAGVLPGFVYGCGQDNEGLFGKAAGLVGLARDKLSLLTQLAPKFGNAFSYCLPTTSSSGFLSLGGYGAGGLSFTPMLTSSSDKSLYFIKLSSISVGQKAIAVSAAAYSSAPTIIDSGTVITRLPTAIYAALSQAVVGALSGYARAPAYSILDTCFKGSYAKLAVPPVSLVFAGGAELKLSAHNVFYDLPSEGITCLAFAKSGNAAIIGNRQQQTFKVVYDIGGSKIGFAPGGCS